MALTRRRRYAAAHLSVTLRVPPPLKGRLLGALPEREGSPWEKLYARSYYFNPTRRLSQET